MTAQTLIPAPRRRKGFGVWFRQIGWRHLVGLTAVGVEGCVPGILELLCEQQPSEELFAEAGRLAAQASSPVEDQRGPVDYKRHLADELTRRVLRRAAARAGALASV